MKSDAVDKRILEMLKQDSRMTNVAIAKSLGMTEGAVRWRIRKMVDTGLVKRFTIDVGSGASMFAVIMVKAKGETKRMMSSIADLKIHKEAYEISGEFDGCVIIEGSSVEDLGDRVDRIRKLDEVSGTRTFISFKQW